MSQAADVEAIRQVLRECGGENIRIIETDEPLPCRPCGLHGHKQCPQQHFRCAWNINIDKLIQQIPQWKEV